MKKLSLSLWLLLLASCTATPTPSSVGPVDIAGTMVQYQVAAGATSNAVSIQMSATAQMIGATSTQFAYATQAAVTEQARVDAIATSDQARRDVEATQARVDFESTQAQARRDAEATQAQARTDAQSTMQAGGTATAFVITQTAIPPANTVAAIATNQALEIGANNVEKSNLEVQELQQKGSVWSWLAPYLVALVATIAGFIFVMRFSRVREVKNDDGDIELVLIDDKAIRPQLLPEPVLVIDAEEVKAVPLTDRAEQSEVTRRAQAVNALKNMPVNPTSAAAQTFNKFFDQPTTEPRFKVLNDGNSNLDVIDEEITKELDQTWKETQ